jgi:hypothetical protein
MATYGATKMTLVEVHEIAQPFVKISDAIDDSPSTTAIAFSTCAVV